ncbi:MAG: thiamine pyrophosphate-dependent acetolactate synthase large subunit-like protein [Candidatus Azotimanducaceae bacterium]|jgi:thiamine pyrophosphate-dependent acetolactate synthase large subunit-like protein
MISGQKPIYHSKQGRFQIVDVVGLMHPLTKLSRQISHGNSVPSLVREAVRLAATERPGAVYLELPEDVAAMDADQTNLFNRSTRKYAESYGAYGVRVEKTEDFLPTLQDCLARKGVNLIELPVDYSENERVLIQELEQKTCLL